MFRHDLGDGCWLARPSLRDAADLFAAVDQSREHLGRWFAWVETTQSPDDVRTFLTTVLEGWVKDARNFLLLRSDAGVLGTIEAFNMSDTSSNCEIGYWLRADQTGRGLMTRATRAMTDWIMGPRGLNRAMIRCLVDNTASRAIPERLGYVLEGVERAGFQRDTTFHDVARYSMLRADWPG